MAKSFVRTIFVLVATFLVQNLKAQIRELPFYDKQKIAIGEDWLVKKVNSVAAVYRDKYGDLVLSNGLVSRAFRLQPNTATVELENLRTGESFISAVKPEAEVQINAIRS